MTKLFRRVYFLLNRRRMERELADEMAAHRETLTGDRRNAFGRDLSLREDARDAWAWVWLDRLWQDLTYAARIFRRSPGFTLGAVAVLALGIGANLAEFHIFDVLILHRLNLDGADSIFRFRRNSKDHGSSSFPIAAVGFYRENCSQCAWMVAENTSDSLIVDGEPDWRSDFVTGNYFAALHILPAWGRLLDERDARPGAAPVAVLGYQYWKNKWAADPHVVNRMVHMNGKPVRIVGVAPYDFDGLAPRGTVVWIPSGQRAVLVPGAAGPAGFNRSPAGFNPSNEEIYARPKPGIGLAAVEAQLTSLTRELAHREPTRFGPGERILGDRLQGTGLTTRKLPPAIALMFLLVLLVLLSACANLGNMLLARGLTRQREMDTRIALGAGRSRVIRQILTENLLLAAMGAAAGLFLGYVAARLLVRALDAPPDVRIAMDWQILVAAAGFAVVSALAFGIAPALQLARGNRKSGRRRQVLVAVQVAVSCLLLIGSAVFTRSAVRNATVDLRFDYRNMVVVNPQLFGKGLPEAMAREKLDALTVRLENLPGTDGVTAAVMPPLGPRFAIDTLPGLPPIYMNFVAPSYFGVMNAPVVRGRTFLTGERDAVIVSESAARAVWPGQDPIGKIWNVETAARAVVGVVKDSGANLIVDSESVEAFVPISGARLEEAVLILHARGEPSQVVRAIPLLTASTGEPLAATLMSASRERVLDNSRKIVIVVGSLGAIATALAAAGMFALVAFAVAQRTREIGIRMAIGAGPSHIIRALVGENLAPVLLGIAAGIVLGVALGILARSLIRIQENPLDPVGFAAGLAVFALIAILATLSPAVKALRIDPASTLRCE